MQHGELDPLDTKNPNLRAKERFRASLAAAMLLNHVFAELRERRPTYFRDLYYRLQSGFDYVDLLRDGGHYDGHVPIHDEDGGVDYWIAEPDLEAMLEVYFPHGPTDAPRLTDGRALVVLILHSALEDLAADLRVPRKDGESAVTAVCRHLFLHEQAEDVKDALVDLRETRNLVAHSSGVVTERYLAVVRGSPFNLNEERTLSQDDIDRFATAVRWAAEGLTAGI